MTTSNQSSNGTQMTQVVSSNINQLIQMIGDVIAHGEGKVAMKHIIRGLKVLLVKELGIHIYTRHLEQ